MILIKKKMLMMIIMPLISKKMKKIMRKIKKIKVFKNPKGFLNLQKKSYENGFTSMRMIHILHINRN